MLPSALLRLWGCRDESALMLGGSYTKHVRVVEVLKSGVRGSCFASKLCCMFTPIDDTHSCKPTNEIEVSDGSGFSRMVLIPPALASEVSFGTYAPCW